MSFFLSHVLFETLLWSSVKYLIGFIGLLTSWQVCSEKKVRMKSREMKVVAFCLLLLLQCASVLDGSLHRPFSAQPEVEGSLQSSLEQSPSPLQRRDARWRRITVSKTSREALEYGLRWATWRHTHSKTYVSSTEALARYVVWRSNIAYIESHNSYADNFGFTLAMNSFGDLVS